ncbi:MAG: 3'-5' exonuclease [Candidatus Kerfeldbacteria bacterium]|nr:3'-5' exonuclease [Candidatus Kerfeldbacteria bacterium]
MPSLSVPSQFAVIDVETTGFKPEEGHVIVELAAQKIQGQTVVEQYQALVQTDRPLGPDNVLFNGISADMLAAEGQLGQDVFPAFQAFLGPAVLIGHNIPFDLAFLNRHFSLLGLPALTNSVLDTLLLSRKYLILPSYSLESVARYLHVPQPAAHRALADVETTRQVFLKLVERALKVGR